MPCLRTNSDLLWERYRRWLKVFCFFLLSAMSCWRALSQNQVKADSLRRELEKMDPESSEYLDLFIDYLHRENSLTLRLEMGKKLAHFSEEVGSLRGIHHAYLQIGQSHRMRGDYDLAIEALFIALDNAKKANHGRGIAGSNTALADLYAELGDFDTSIQYYQRSLDWFGDEKSYLKAGTLLNIGDTYFMLERYDSALMYLEEAQSLYENSINDPEGFAYTIGNIGLVKGKLGDLEGAQESVAASIDSLWKLGDHYGRCIFLGYMSDIYFEQGLTSKATSFADSCLRVATRFGIKSEVRDNLLRLSTICASRNEYKTAYEFHKQYAAMRDSISNEEVFSRIENLESEFALSQKQAEVDILKARQRTNQVVIVTSSVVVFIFAILVIVIFAYYRSKIKVNRLLEMQNSALERLNETKDKFFSIISHDLRGPVSSLMGVGQLIRHFVKKKEEEQLVEIAGYMEESVDRISSLLDNLLNWAMQQQGHFPNVPEKVNLNMMLDEIIAMFSNMADGKEITLSHTITRQLYLWVDRNSVHTIFRNLINNSIKFTPKGGSVTILAEKQGKNVRISVSDTGVGIPSEKLEKLFVMMDKKSSYGTAGEKGLGLGLLLVQEFVEMNNGTIQVESVEDKGTIFSIEVPAFAEQLQKELEEA